MKTLAYHAKIVSIALCFAGCREDTKSGSGEQFRVYLMDGQPAEFFTGRLPAPSLVDAGTVAGINGDAGAVDALSLPPDVIGFNPTNRIIFPGQKLGAINGTLSANSAAVALALDTGSGYWVVPAGSPDVTSEGQLEWKVKCDFSSDIQTGYHELTATAVGADGVFGSSKTKKLCVAGRTVDYINACEPKAVDPNHPLPQAVISLSWDTNVDLDLQVVTPEGRLVTPKYPTTLALDPAGAIPADSGIIDRDSNAGCNIDGIRYENLHFDQVMPTGTWGIYVDLFDACKLPVVHFAVTVYVSQTGEDGYAHLVPVGSRQGVLLASQVSGGQGAVGTYLFEVNF